MRAIDAAQFRHALNELPRVMTLIGYKTATGAALTEPAAPAVTALPVPSPDNLRTALGLT